MAQLSDNPLIRQSIDSYLSVLANNSITVSRLYLFGSYAKGTQNKDSDIDLAVFCDRDEVDPFDDGLRLLRLTRTVDLRIEPHAFSRKDLENPDPFVKEILETGQRIV